MQFSVMAKTTKGLGVWRSRYILYYEHKSSSNLNVAMNFQARILLGWKRSIRYGLSKYSGYDCCKSIYSLLLCVCVCAYIFLGYFLAGRSVAVTASSFILKTETISSMCVAAHFQSEPIDNEMGLVGSV